MTCGILIYYILRHFGTIKSSGNCSERLKWRDVYFKTFIKHSFILYFIYEWLIYFWIRYKVACSRCQAPIYLWFLHWLTLFPYPWPVLPLSCPRCLLWCRPSGYWRCCTLTFTGLNTFFRFKDFVLSKTFYSLIKPALGLCPWPFLLQLTVFCDY